MPYPEVSFPCHKFRYFMENQFNYTSYSSQQIYITFFLIFPFFIRVKPTTCGAIFSFPYLQIRSFLIKIKCFLLLFCIYDIPHCIYDNYKYCNRSQQPLSILSTHFCHFPLLDIVTRSCCNKKADTKSFDFISVLTLWHF